MPQTDCECPWNYAASRYDSKTGLYYNLSRYYDPIVKRWLSLDTAGFADSMNLYAYVLNNPCRYIDPQGKFVFMIPILIFGGELTVALICDALITSAIVGTLSFGAVQLEDYVNKSLSRSPPSVFNIQQGWYERGVDLENSLKKTKKKKSEDVYVPDRPLPNNPNGTHMPDSDAPHTQLGTKEGRFEKYPQAREFDGKGNAIKDIDFTDHGYPSQHPNPHQHVHQPNKTGGTPKRGDPEPLAYWNYY